MAGDGNGYRGGLKFVATSTTHYPSDSPLRYNANMVRHVDAIFTQGALRPLEPLSFPEGTRVHLSVEAVAGTDALRSVAKVFTPKLANPKDSVDFVMTVGEDRDAGV
jgi:predicted DNA-binding antitoxin AbrB/MazE fold protein